MRILNVKISGYKAIPFCADFSENPNKVNWHKDGFQFNLSTKPPYLYSIIGPNSCGKSSIFYALEYFFGSTTKINNEELYHDKLLNKPIIIEVAFIGNFDKQSEWYDKYCEKKGSAYIFKLISVTTAERRTQYIRKPNDDLKKVTSSDKQEIEKIKPIFRIIPSNCKLIDQVNPEKKNFSTDLVNDLIIKSSSASNRSILYKIEKNLSSLEDLVTREHNNPSASWKEIERLESTLSSNLSGFTPGNPSVIFSINESIPTMEEIFLKGRFSIIDDVEVSYENHGVGMQRIFLISILESWANLITHQKDKKDYFFAIEEPELFLHPHAIRILLDTLKKISKNDQVVFSTHSGEFVNNVSLSNVIKIKREKNKRNILNPDFSTITLKELTKIQRYLLEDRSDMLFARAVLLVEGQTEYFAIPGFSKTLGKDLDRNGISVVFVNGKDNFPIYHKILEKFEIPHLILGDGDGNRSHKENLYKNLADDYEVLDFDFEYLIASTISKKRMIRIINKCRTYQGKNRIKKLECCNITANQLKKGWWESIKDDIYSDISKEYRTDYKKELSEIKKSF